MRAGPLAYPENVFRANILTCESLRSSLERSQARNSIGLNKQRMRLAFMEADVSSRLWTSPRPYQTGQKQAESDGTSDAVKVACERGK